MRQVLFNMPPVCTNHGLQVGPEPMAHPPDKVGLQLLPSGVHLLLHGTNIWCSLPACRAGNLVPDDIVQGCRGIDLDTSMVRPTLSSEVMMPRNMVPASRWGILTYCSSSGAVSSVYGASFLTIRQVCQVHQLKSSKIMPLHPSCAMAYCSKYLAQRKVGKRRNVSKSHIKKLISIYFCRS